MYRGHGCQTVAKFTYSHILINKNNEDILRTKGNHFGSNKMIWIILKLEQVIHKLRIVSKIVRFHLIIEHPLKINMRGSRNFRQGGPGQSDKKALTTFFFFSPQLILQKSNG